MTQSDNDVETPDDVPPFLEDALRRFSDDKAALRGIRDFAAALLDEAVAPSAEEVRATNTDGKVVSVTDGDGGTLVKKKVTCGTETCRCASGEPGDMHGPYAYLVSRDGDGVEWEYVGKVEGGE